MNQEDNRNYPRFNYEKLPDIIKEFHIKRGDNKKIKAKTYDASIGGLGLIVPVSSDNYIKGEEITLEAKDQSFSLKGEIIYSFNLANDENSMKIGIDFSSTRALKKYLKVVIDKTLSGKK